MINAGAITTASMVAGRSPADALERLLAVFSIYAGRPLEIDDAVYRSEKATGHRNRAIGHKLRNFDIVTEDPDVALDLYFKQCSILVDCRDLALMAATLANGGVHPVTGQRAIRHDLVERVLSVMTTCGMYDFAGEWVYAVGMPSKSGVGGGIMAVLPGQLGIAVFSPRLDARGNSVRGVAVCKDLSHDFNLHFLRVPRSSRAIIRGDFDLTDMRSRRLRTESERAILEANHRRARILRLHGDLAFAGVETVVRRVVDAIAELDFVIVDVQRLTQVEPCTVGVLAELIMQLLTLGKQLVLVGAQEHGAFRRALEEALIAADHPGGMRAFDDLDPALEWCENRILAAAGPKVAPAVALEAHELCVGLDARALAAFSRVLRPRRYAQGEVIIRQGDPAEEIYLLMSGVVSVTLDLPDGRRRRLSTVPAGAVFGELTVVDRSGRTADVRADTPVECLVLPAAELDGLAETNPSLKITLLTNLLRNVQRTVARLDRQVTALGG
jgi:glutaminase